MKNYHLNTLLSDCYAHWPREGQRPLVGVTANYADQTLRLGEGYYRQIVAAGGLPVVLPPLADREALFSTLDRIDALLLSGGADINPLYAGEQPHPRLGAINSERDLPELLLCRLAANRQMPILGICRGIQTMAMALGGHVAQHIETTIKHSQEAPRTEPTHTVTLAPGSLLARLYASAPVSPLLGAPCPVDGGSAAMPLAVNSFHHQAVDDAGEHFRVAALAPDGTIEAIESAEEKPFIGVQWHPECMGDDGLPLFRWLVEEAALYQTTRHLHHHIVTLDTHCDTPMLFPQGIDFATRDPRMLVSLPKMREGMLDATIMVAYLPQKGWDADYRMVAPESEGLKGSPRQYADYIFSRISQIAADNSSLLALARTPDDLLQNKRAGKKSIMLGIENGLALEGRVENVRHFAERGVVYITLCHNGDNNLCDSASGTKTHGGVSQLGAQVIGEMNRLGVMVDLSHAAESSFYDALDISTTPIVCSHSSARALCDHPRNLTDEQMRRLAAKGGVCQVTLYHGFLKTDGEATILDAMQHLEHAVRVMGIDHVGLGSDFDGDGGVRGLADASELTLYTRQLLRRRFSAEDIQKLWGGNFLRVMKEVQRV